MRTAPKTARQGNGNILRSMFAASMSVAAIAAATTGAYFTDSQAVDGNQFTTGTVDVATDKTTAIVAHANLAPGDAKVGQIVVTNAGSLEMRYAVSSKTTEDYLAAQLDLVVWNEADEGADANTDCATSAPADATLHLYTTGNLGSFNGINLIGNPAQGPHTGDRVLIAKATETLCFRVELPFSTNNDYQAKTTTATFTFAAEQTVNNTSTTA